MFADFRLPTQSDLEDVGIEFFKGCATAYATSGDMYQIGAGFALRKLISCIEKEQIKKIDAWAKTQSWFPKDVAPVLIFTVQTAAAALLLKTAHYNRAQWSLITAANVALAISTVAMSKITPNAISRSMDTLQVSFSYGSITGHLIGCDSVGTGVIFGLSAYFALNSQPDVKWHKKIQLELLPYAGTAMCAKIIDTMWRQAMLR